MPFFPLNFRRVVPFALVAAFSLGAGAQEDAQGILKAFADRLSEAPGVSVAAEVTYELKVEGEEESVTTMYDLALEPDGKLSLHVTNDSMEVLFTSDGETFVTFIPEFDQYTSSPTLDSFTDVVGRSGFPPITGVTELMAEFVKPSAFAELLDGATVVDASDGETQIRVSRDDTAWDLWFSGGATPVLERLTLDTTALRQEVKDATGVETELRVFARFHEWSFGDVDDATFAFIAPADAEMVAQFGPPQPKNGPFELLGKPAPDFTLDLMGGGTLSIASKPDDEVYILDFWATWCGPCRRAMPIIESVTAEFADQGVKLFAVNLQEQPAQIKEFLDSQDLDVTVALDTDGASAQLYKARSIPQTVIVAKDGTVQVVHVGIGPTLETQLREELSALVKGESLVD